MPRITAQSLMLFFIAIIGASAGRAGERVLYVYSWEKYFAPEVIEDFEKKHRCRVEFDHFESNDTMFEKVRRGDTGYDIIVSAANLTDDLHKAGQLLKLDHALLPHLSEVEAEDTAQFDDTAFDYHVPYTMSVTGVAYSRAAVPESALGSWDIFANPEFRDRAAMMNDMRYTLGAGLKFLGYSLNSENWDEINQAGQVLREWKRNIKTFGVDEPRKELEAGELAIVQAYNGDIAHMDNPDIGFYIPREGSMLNSDSLIVPVDAEHPELAHAFIDHFLIPENASRNMQSISYYMPNPKALALLPDELRDHPAFHIPEEVLATCEPVKTVGNAYLLYEEIWLLLLMGDM